MKRLVTLVVALSVCAVCGVVLMGAIRVTPGSAVPDSFAAQLRGGCNGVVIEYCTVNYNCTATAGADDDITGDNYNLGVGILYCVDSTFDCLECFSWVSCGNGG